MCYGRFRLTLFWLIVILVCVLGAFGNAEEKTSSQKLKTPTTNNSNKKRKNSLRMSKLAKQHLSDEHNPNNYPKLIGVDFSGKKVLVKNI